MPEEFTVNDKRLFSKEGEIREEAEASAKPTAAGETKPGGARGAGGAGVSSAGLPPASFAGLLIGLATSALMHLGENPEPGAPPTPPNLPAAQHTIDLLAILQDKTRGNLQAEEASLLETLLYDLRLKFVQARA
ncbi:MAG: DUF1844 domain-containing protein [Candidatus Adiutrix sp.]|jgi:hypothetical protein|nr:DUF1844 domain-containing protein [Candidatus Adiutrix sp.]